MPVYDLQHFDKAATIEHMKGIVKNFPVEVLGSPDVATLKIAADEKTVKQIVEKYNWFLKPQV